jgi:hypothetical protein
MEMKVPFQVVCLDSKNRPNDIPSSRWVVEGQTYTVIKVGKMLIQNGLVGFKLQELNIDEFYPYQFFAASRFGLPKVDWDIEAELERILKEAQEEVKELNTYYSE